MQLNYKTYGEGRPLVILHGLLGSLDNWNTLAKKFAKNQYQVFIVDQRNHGDSPHSASFNYEVLAADLYEFCERHQLDKINLIGHSMGGKVAMYFAHHYPEKIDKLIVADIAPVKYQGSHELIFKSLMHLNIAGATRREEVEEELALTIKDFGVRQFLLKGLGRRNKDNNFEWKYNLDALWNNYAAILDTFPLKQAFNDEVLFINGANSDYVNDENEQQISQYFPNYKKVTLENAGHWLHAEKPKEFLEKCLVFLA